MLLMLHFFSDLEDLESEYMTKKEAERMENEIEEKATKLVEDKSYTWKPVQYDETAAWSYLLAKAPFDYACVIKALGEIANREGDSFKYAERIETNFCAEND